MKRTFLYFLVICVLSVSLTDVFCENGSLEVVVTDLRHSFYRNEKTAFHISVKNHGETKTKALRFSARTGLLKEMKKKFSLSPGTEKMISYPIDCKLLKPGEYSLDIRIEHNNNVITEKFTVYISEHPNPQRLSVHYWGGSANMMDWGLEHGFNTFQVFASGPLTEDNERISSFRELFDKAVRKRVNLGFYYYTVSSGSFHDHPGVFGVYRRTEGEPERSEKDKKICLREPLVIERSKNTIHSLMQLFGIYPSFYQALINSEFRSNPCYSERCRSIMKKEAGLNLYDYNVDPLHPPKTKDEAVKAGLPPKLVSAVPVGGIIEDDNPYYKYYMWWWKRGMGDALLNEKLSDIIKSHKSDVITWHDPFRLAPVYGRHRGLDCIGQWTYTHPDPKYTAYTETLITGAKPTGKKIMPDMTTWEYQNWLALTDSGVVFIPPHILRENCWIALSRRPDIVCHYISSLHNPTKEVDTWRRDPRSFEMMTWMSENVYKPYGAFILQMERTPRKAAILCSASSVLFPEINRGGWPNKSIYPFYSLLSMAHIPTDVIFDETIVKYGLDQYDILFLHQCETLTRSVYEKILVFKKRGGIVVGDSLLRANIPEDYSVPFDLNHRKRQLADLVLKGEGVTADEDKEIMVRNTWELRRALDGKVERYVDSNSPEVVLNVLESGPVKYIFLVNDRRTYGEWFGKWKTFHEKGEEQIVVAKIHQKGDSPILYNVRTHSLIPVERKGDTHIFSVRLDPCDGTIVAVYPEALKKVQVTCPKVVKRGKRGKMTVKVTDSAGDSYGTQPIKVEIEDAEGTLKDYSDYYATKNGVWSLNLTPALNDAAGVWKVRVQELTSGIETATHFEVR